MSKPRYQPGPFLAIRSKLMRQLFRRGCHIMKPG